MLPGTFLLFFLSLFICSCSIVAEKHLKLPSFIKQCSKSAADFDECCLQHAKESMPVLLKGVKEYNVPELNPLVLQSVEMNTDGLKVTFTDLHIFGIDTIDLKQVKFDLSKNKFGLHCYFDSVSFIGKYDCDGNVGILPIQGKGDINVTIVGFDVHYDAKYKVEEIGGDEYMVFTSDAKVDFTAKRTYFNLENLFGGDAQLGAITNKALNDDWETFMEGLKPALSQTVIEVAQAITGGVTSNVPLKYLFLE